MDVLVQAAETARGNAYAPYSGFRVGAALRTRGGRIVVGCNVENAAFPVAICAERAALAAAVSLGEREFDALAVVSDAREPSPPCGVCRQALVEFAPNLLICSRTTSGAEARWSLAELLVQPFTSVSLQRQ
jgi:cytidine deaminase